ncbi:zinc knuckle CX2CX4HX4C containing protein [Tanacetum coccineum]|uniref:Zinc knuckle CX2CX4HX4C containing protein n=1 Tax=Tanacetum coccineum TaxID=301880 RepID=A0ABQ4XFD8_9ASTR
MAWNVIACLHVMDVIDCLQNMVDKLAFMAWLLACLRGMDGKESRDDGSDVLGFIDKGDSRKGIKSFVRGVVIDVDDVVASVQHLNGDSGVSDAGKPHMETSPRVRNYSPLVSPIATINMPRGLFNVDVAATFGVLLTIVGDLDVLTKDIQAGKHEELLSGMTNEKRTAVMDALVAMCDSIEVEPVISLHSEVSPSDHIIQYVYIHKKPSSYIGEAGGSKPEPSKAKANFCLSFSKKLCVGATFSIPRKVVETVSTRFANTSYGYFIGKRIAFSIMEYYVRNNWGKYGLTRIMMNSKGFFFFQLKNTKGLEDVLENGPWMICNSPIILKKQTMNTRLCKDELTRIQPIMFDSYTSVMCIESWGRSSFAQCLIEINVEDVLKESLTIGVPLIEGSRYTIETVTIKYELKPPCCDLCKIFGHIYDHCPKKVSIPPTVVTSNVVIPTVEKTNDGFQIVVKKKKGKSKSTNGGQFSGHLVKQTVRYEPKTTTSAPKKGATNVGNASKSSSTLKTSDISTKKGNITMSNSYSAIDDESDEDVEVI